MTRHWLLVINLLMTVFVGLPWLAPVLMHSNHPRAASAIYLIYSTQCHQLPQRSFFLFGHQASYSLPEIQAAWQNTANPFILRRFVGNPDMGWKVAWSDRMVAMYTPIWLLMLAWPLLHKRLRPLSVWQFVALIVPLALDGATHFISDLNGLGQGFRDSNAWLALLTDHAFPAWFYAGDALGSFNSWLRLVTGSLFGLGVAWFALHHLAQFAADIHSRPAG